MMSWNMIDIGQRRGGHDRLRRERIELGRAGHSAGTQDIDRELSPLQWPSDRISHLADCSNYTFIELCKLLTERLFFNAEFRKRLLRHRLPWVKLPFASEEQLPSLLICLTPGEFMRGLQISAQTGAVRASRRCALSLWPNGHTLTSQYSHDVKPLSTSVVSQRYSWLLARSLSH